MDQPVPPTGDLPAEATRIMNEQAQKEASQQDVPAGVLTPSGFFTGFEIISPEYEVVTPQTLATYTIRGMVVAEEERLKASMLTTRKIPEHLNDVIWDCLVKKPDLIKHKDDFLNMTTIKDRDALIYGLYHITYKDENNYDVKCPGCENTHTVTVKLSNIFTCSAWTGEPFDILSKMSRIKLEKAKDAWAVVKQPTLRDEKEVLDDMLFQTPANIEMGMEMLPIARFEIAKDPTCPLIVDGKDNLFNAYKQLPASDRKLINAEYIEKFGKYSIDLNFVAQCPKCGKQSDTNFDLVDQFFRAVVE